MRFAKPTRRMVLLCAWFLLTTVTSVAVWRAWGMPDAMTGETGRFDQLCKLVANGAQTVNAPFWFVAWAILGGYKSYVAAMIINGTGYMFWLGGLLVLLRAREFARGLPARTASATHENDEPAPMRGLAPAAAFSRRAFMTDAALATGVACAGGMGVYSSFVTPWSLRTTRYTVPIADLPASLDGFRLVQLTDTHLGPRIPAKFVRDAVELARSLKPDMFLLTGDYVHMGTTYIAPAAELFRPLTERRPGLVGTVGVLGNHDYYADARMVNDALEEVGVRMLTNSRVFLDPGSRELAPIARTGEMLCIAGVDDDMEGRVDIAAAYRDVPRSMPRILLSHNPDVAENGLLATLDGRTDLMISGHTHGGQVRLPFIGSPGIPSRNGQKYAYGVIKGPSCPVLVSAGIGMSLIPVRVGVPPEVVEITLTRARTA